MSHVHTHTHTYTQTQGHHFQILETSDGRQAADEGVWRDVYGVSGGSSVVIRFRVTNQTGE